MNTAQFLATYESISDLTGNMLTAARASDWDRLVELEKNCAGLIEKLQAAGGGPAYDDPAYIRAKSQIIRKVLSDDAEIRNLTQPWLAHLQNMLVAASHNNKLARTYGGTGTPG